MNLFQLYLLIQNKDKYIKELISSTETEVSTFDSLLNGVTQSKQYTNYSYNESISFSLNAQKTLSFTMDRYIMREDMREDNPFVHQVTNGSLLLVVDRFNNHYLFTVTDIKHNISEMNIVYSFTCSDAFSYQLTRQNNGYTIENNPESADFIGAKTIDDWVLDYIQPECYIQYKYRPLSDSVHKDSYPADKYPDYHELIPFSCSGATALSALIDLGSQLDLQLITYELLQDNGDNTYSLIKEFWYEPIKNADKISGLVYSPYDNITDFSFSHNGESLTTILNVKGKESDDEVITLLPSVPKIFLDLFISPKWYYSQYKTGYYTEYLLNQTSHPTDDELLFAKIADVCPWLENKIIDISYFYDNNLISKQDYKDFYNIVNGELRICNGKLLAYSKAYYDNLHEQTKIMAQLQNDLDTIGAALQADVIMPLINNQVDRITDDTDFINALSLIYRDKDNKQELINYNELLSDYFTKYFNARQRFLKNIKNFKDYFNAMSDSIDTLKKYIITVPTSFQYANNIVDTEYQAIEESIDSNTIVYEEKDDNYTMIPVVDENNYKQFYVKADGANWINIAEPETYSKDYIYQDGSGNIKTYAEICQDYINSQTNPCDWYEYQIQDYKVINWEKAKEQYEAIYGEPIELVSINDDAFLHQKLFIDSNDVTINDKGYIFKNAKGEDQQEYIINRLNGTDTEEDNPLNYFIKIPLDYSNDSQGIALTTLPFTGMLDVYLIEHTYDINRNIISDYLLTTYSALRPYIYLQYNIQNNNNQFNIKSRLMQLPAAKSDRAKDKLVQFIDNDQNFVSSFNKLFINQPQHAEIGVLTAWDDKYYKWFLSEINYDDLNHKVIIESNIPTVNRILPYIMTYMIPTGYHLQEWLDYWSQNNVFIYGDDEYYHILQNNENGEYYQSNSDYFTLASLNKLDDEELQSYIIISDSLTPIDLSEYADNTNKLNLSNFFEGNTNYTESQDDEGHTYYTYIVQKINGSYQLITNWRDIRPGNTYYSPNYQKINWNALPLIPDGWKKSLKTAWKHPTDNYNTNNSYYNLEGEEILHTVDVPTNGYYCKSNVIQYQNIPGSTDCTFNVNIPVYQNGKISTTQDTYAIVEGLPTINSNSIEFTNYIDNNIVTQVNVIDDLTINNMSNGQYWLEYHDSNIAVLQKNALIIETQLTEYWGQAYSASLLCDYFLPDSWLPQIDTITNGCYHDIIVNGELSSTYIPNVELYSENGRTLFPYYSFKYMSADGSSDLIEPIKDTLNSVELSSESWNTISYGGDKYSYYIPEENTGMTWQQFLNKHLTQWSNQKMFYSGQYAMFCHILYNYYQLNQNINYQNALKQHDRIWNKLYSKYGHILLENEYSNETATDSEELLLLAQYAFKGYAQPERQYNLALLDTSVLKGYQGQELYIGSAVQVDAQQYYDEYDQVFKTLSQFLFISDLSYDLRNPTNIAVTVNDIKYSDKLIKRLAKLVK